jgi:hypothetical protein
MVPWFMGHRLAHSIRSFSRYAQAEKSGPSANVLAAIQMSSANSPG